MFIINKIFALFKSGKYIGKEVKVTGWYRRSPVPYIEIYQYTIDGQVKKVWTYKISLVLFAILAIAGIVCLFI